MQRALLLLLLAGAAQAAETWVVAVGVEKYDDPGITPLRYAVADVRSVAQTFRDGGVPADHVTVLASDAADRAQLPTRANVLRALQRARERARAGDTLVVMFSGHGVEHGEQPYLLTIDANLELLTATALPVSLVHAALRGFQGEHLVLIVDACRNDPIAGKGDVDDQLDESFAKGLRPVRSDLGGPGAEATLLLACDVGQRAWEMPDEGHGAFTYFLLEALGGAAKDDQGQVKLGAVTDYVTTEMASWCQRARREQTPRLDNPSGSDFVLLKPAPDLSKRYPEVDNPVVELTIENRGTIDIQLFPEQAPKNCSAFLYLVRSGGYVGTWFHRVVPDFVAQGGDLSTKDLEPGDRRAGGGEAAWSLPLEVSPELKHVAGAVAMARAAAEDSGGSQFYLCLEPQPFLDGKYTVFGKILTGLDVMAKLSQGDRITATRVVQGAERTNPAGKGPLELFEANDGPQRGE